MTLTDVLFSGLIFSISVGDPVPSKKPPMLTAFKKNDSGGHDQTGGGVVIPCSYILYVKPGYVAKVHEKLTQQFRELDIGNVVIEDESHSCVY